MKYTAKQFATALINTIDLEKMDVDQATDDLVTLLSERHELKRLDDIIRAIDLVWIERHGAAMITIQTAHPLTGTLRKRLSQIGKGAQLHEEVNEDLIGGARVRMDDRVIDGSISGYLRQLKNALNV